MNATATEEAKEERHHECSAPSEKKAPKQQCTLKKAPVDEVLREIVHDALSHCGDQTLDETITRKVMHDVEELTTSLIG